MPPGSGKKLPRYPTVPTVRMGRLVDAKDEAATAFYRHHGFIALPDAARTLFMPLASVRPAQPWP